MEQQVCEIWDRPVLNRLSTLSLHRVRQTRQVFLTLTPNSFSRMLQAHNDGQTTLAWEGTLSTESASPAQAEPDTHNPMGTPGFFSQASFRLGSWETYWVRTRATKSRLLQDKPCGLLGFTGRTALPASPPIPSHFQQDQSRKTPGHQEEERGRQG